MKTAGWKERLTGWLFPARCLGCGQVIPAGPVFCEACRKKVPEIPLERLFCPPGSGSGGLRVVSPLPYEGGFRKTLHSLKFRGQRSLARPLGGLMAGAVPPEDRWDGVVWVPLTAKGKRRRGYDQSGLLAKALAEERGLPCLPLLEKVRDTRAQHDLSRREREENVKSAYRALPGAEGKALLLVDDVVTTGATLLECAAELYRAGAVRLLCVCAFDNSGIQR